MLWPKMDFVLILLEIIFALLLRTFVHNKVLCYFSTCILVTSFLKRFLKQNLNKNGPVGLVLDLGPHNYNINTGRDFITSFSSGTRISCFVSGLGNLKTDISISQHIFFTVTVHFLYEVRVTKQKRFSTVNYYPEISQIATIIKYSKKLCYLIVYQTDREDMQPVTRMVIIVVCRCLL